MMCEPSIDKTEEGGVEGQGKSRGDQAAPQKGRGE